MSLSQVPRGFGARYRGFPAFPAFLARSNCLKTAKLRRQRKQKPFMFRCSQPSETLFVTSHLINYTSIGLFALRRETPKFAKGFYRFLRCRRDISHGPIALIDTLFQLICYVRAQGRVVYSTIKLTQG